MRTLTWAAGAVCAAGAISAAFSAFYIHSLPPRAAAPPDASLLARLSALRDATPEAAAALEKETAAERASLGRPDSLDRLGEELGPNWTTLARSTEALAGLERRRFALAYGGAKAQSWPEVLRAVRLLCAQPGVSLDSLILEASPDGAEGFAQAQITFTARIRP